MTNIPSSFTIPGTFITIEGTGDATSGSNNVILLAQSTALTAGTGATFDITSTEITTYTPKAVTLNAAGTGYAVNDTIVINNVGTITVTKIGTDGAISTISASLLNESFTMDMSGTGLTGTTSGSGTGATFDVTSTTNNQFVMASVSVNQAGTGYHVGDSFTFPAGTATVSRIGANGNITDLTFVETTNTVAADPAGTGITATKTNTISGPVNTLTYASSQSSVDSVYGSASDISRMYARYRTVDTVSPVYVIVSNSDSAEDLTTCLNTIAEQSFSVIASPFNSSSSLSAFDTFFDTRYGYASELYGIHLTVKTDTVANLITYGAGNNSKYTTVVGFAPGSIDDDVVKAAAVAAVIAPSLASDPSIPLQLMELNVAPATSGFSIPDRLSLFNSGLATTKETAANEVYLERSRTTYQTNADGVSDDTYQDTETLPQVTLVSTTFRTGVNSKYFTNGMKLAADSSTVIAGQNVATPSAIKATLISLYKNMASAGLVTDEDNFSKNVTVTIKSRGVVSVYAPVTLVEQLRQINIEIDFTK